MSAPGNARLRCMSFHSVKGGVGKSTLAVAAAAELDGLGLGQVHLVDFDLTGTSIADVLPLEAPRWPTGEDGKLDFGIDARPNGFDDVQASRDLMKRRAFHGVKGLRDGDATAGAPRWVPLLNDWLLYADPSWSPDKDIDPKLLAWRWDSILVQASSALPADVARMLPLVYDEENAGALESRVEWLLDHLVPNPGETACVVFDTPPTIPGLSRSILSLALRLSRRPKVALARDGFIPPRLEMCTIDWTAFVVVSQDGQDLVAAGRWLDLTEGQDFQVVRLIANRMDQSDVHSLHSSLRDFGIEERFFKDAIPVRNDPQMSLRHWNVPPLRTALGEALDARGVLTGSLP